MHLISSLHFLQLTADADSHMQIVPLIFCARKQPLFSNLPGLTGPRLVTIDLWSLSPFFHTWVFFVLWSIWLPLALSQSGRHSVGYVVSCEVCTHMVMGASAKISVSIQNFVTVSIYKMRIASPPSLQRSHNNA